ncbi:MAG: glycosyltransferase family 4 protein [Anaerolineae bacterium]|nr:glycosyltransferase family 4 protein [Anaerolineae bacterium]
MNIGFVSTRLAGVDGVSLETEKMDIVLQRMGHSTFYCAGELDEHMGARGMLIPEMHFQHSEIMEIQALAFDALHPPRALFSRIYAMADYLRQELRRFVHNYNIDLLISQNSSTIPMNLPLGIAIRDLVARTRIPLLCHHHDFYWERERFMNHGIQDILDEAFPPNLEPIRHLVISTVAQRELRSRSGIRATYLPNVFDFANPPAPPDGYGDTFRQDLGLRDDDILILQPTRVVRRKGIERAIELVEKLEDPRAVLVITGDTTDEPGSYGDWLAEQARRAGIRCIFAAEWIDDDRGSRSGHKVYSLWDVYPHADLITYPSIIEGFGNALIEMVYFRKPFAVHKYPIYRADIRPAGIRAIEFNYDITEDIVRQVKEVLHNADLRAEIVAHNYEVGRQHFSYEVMEDTLETVLRQFTGL